MNLQPESKRRSRATITDVARKAGVSIATVSRVINQTAAVAPETESQVRAAITALNYRPQSAARVLASRKTKTIGLLIPEISGDFFSPLLRGIEAETRNAGFALLIYATQREQATEATDLQPLREHNTGGMLVFVNSLPEKELIRLDQIEFPVVLIHCSSPEGLNIPCVTIENKHSAQAMIDHLIEVHNCRRIAFLTGADGQEDSYWREMGYRESLAAHDIPFDPQLVTTGGFNRHDAHKAIANWLREGLAFDAVFAGDDEAAVGVLTALKAGNKRVPEDVAVTGFDDLHLSRYLHPPLTTVRAPTEQVGREATRQLVRLIQEGEADPLVLLPTELVIRQSCGCAGP